MMALQKIFGYLLVLFFTSYCSGETQLSSTSLLKNRTAESAVKATVEEETLESSRATGGDSPVGDKAGEGNADDEEQIAQAPVIISGSYLHCAAGESYEGSLNCLPVFSQDSRSDTYHSRVTLVLESSDGMREEHPVHDSSQRTGEVFMFEVQDDVAGTMGWVVMEVSNEFKTLTFALPLNSLEKGSGWKLDPLDAGESLPESLADAVVKEPDMQAAVPPGFLTHNVENVHVGNDNLGGLFAGLFNRDCSREQIDSSGLVGSEMYIAFDIAGPGDEDDDDPVKNPLLSEISLSGLCGVDRSAQAELVSADDGRVLASVPVDVRAKIVEFKDLALSEAGSYYLRVTVGAVVNDPDDIFIGSARFSYQGNITFSAVSGSPP